MQSAPDGIDLPTGRPDPLCRVRFVDGRDLRAVGPALALVYMQYLYTGTHGGQVGLRLGRRGGDRGLV